MKVPTRLLMALLIMIAVTTSCATDKPSVYRGGERVQKGPLTIQEHYSFRFVDKWRISHKWLSGPLELRGCRGYGSNSFRRLMMDGPLGIENMEPLIEKNGIIFVVYEHKGIFKVSSPRNYIYGTNRDNKFKGFLPFCGHTFKDSLDSLELYIVKPDSAKSTNEWIEGAKPVTINGLQWLHKKMPIRDWSESRERLSAPIEYWVLKVPQTQYWMMLRFSASSNSKFGLGADVHAEKHQRLLELFHDIVKSVKLEPITPINLDYLLMEAR